MICITKYSHIHVRGYTQHQQLSKEEKYRLNEANGR